MGVKPGTCAARRRYHSRVVSEGFSTQDIARMLGLSPGRLRAYVKAGLLCPQRGEGGELRFSFQDLLLLRTAEGLVGERLPPRRVRDALLRLREKLPSERPLTGVQLASEGGAVVVRDGGARWDADSGQMLIDFESRRRDGVSDDLPAHGETLAPIALSTARRPTPAASALGSVGPLDGAPANGSGLESLGAGTVAPATEPEPEPSIDELYELACSLEETAPEAARAAYQRVLARSPRHADAHVNVGRLMHEAGDLPFAEEHYRAALRERPSDPVALYNLGVVLEDMGRTDEALDRYEAALAADPANADGHFNAARLYERTGRYEAALRHLRAYRNLTAKRT